MNLVDSFQINGIKCNLEAQGWHVDSGNAAIYPPASDDMIDWAEAEIGGELPEAMKEVLKSTNGCFCKKLNVFGIPPSSYEGRGVNRRQLEPLSIVLANNEWRRKYDAPLNTVMVGSKQGWSENTGLFMQHNGLVVEVNASGVSPPFSLSEEISRLVAGA